MTVPTPQPPNWSGWLWIIFIGLANVFFEWVRRNLPDRKKPHGDDCECKKCKKSADNE